MEAIAQAIRSLAEVFRGAFPWVYQSDYVDKSTGTSAAYTDQVVLSMPSANTYYGVSDLSITMTTLGGDVLVSWSLTFAAASGRNWFVRLAVDNVGVVKQPGPIDGTGRNISGTFILKGLSPGTHTFQIQASYDGANGLANPTVYDRFMSALELKK